MQNAFQSWTVYAWITNVTDGRTDRRTDRTGVCNSAVQSTSINRARIQVTKRYVTDALWRMAVFLHSPLKNTAVKSRQCVLRSYVRPLTPISCDAISLYPVEGFQRNLEHTFMMWVGIAEQWHHWGAGADRSGWHPPGEGVTPERKRKYGWIYK